MKVSLLESIQGSSVPPSYRPVAPTVIDEELSSFQAYEGPSGCPCSVRTRPARLYVPPPPPPVRRRAVTARRPASYPPPSVPPSSPPPPAWRSLPAPIAHEVAPTPTPVASFPPPALLPHLDTPRRSSTSRRMFAPLLALAACLMGASLVLSASGGLRGHHEARTALGSGVEPSSAASLAREMSLSELAGEPASPAPTLGRLPVAPAIVALAAKHAEAASSAAAPSGIPAASGAPVASAATGAAPPDAPPDKPRLEQASRTAQMLRDQLNSSVR